MSFLKRSRPGPAGQTSPSSPAAGLGQISASVPTNLVEKGEIDSRANDIKFAEVVASGDPEAINIFCERYADGVYRYVGSLARDLNDEDIEEIVQITMTAATANIRAYKGKSSLQTWVFSLARYKLYDLLRQKQSRDRREVAFSRMPEHWDPAHDSRVEEEILDREFRKQVRQAVNQLPRQEAEVLSLRYMVGMGTDEIAQVIGKSERATQKILTQARARIRNILLPLVQNE